MYWINDIESELAVTTVGAIPTLQGGVAVMQSNGDYTYTSAAGYVGDDSFVYTMENTSGLTCSANVTITVVSSIGGVPCINTTNADDDVYFLCQDSTISGNVLANDSDAEGHTQTVTTTTVTTVEGVVVTIDANTGVFSYTPPAGFVGVDRFVYSIEDDAVAPSNPAPATDSATVYLVVFAGNNT